MSRADRDPLKRDSTAPTADGSPGAGRTRGATAPRPGSSNMPGQPVQPPGGDGAVAVDEGDQVGPDNGQAVVAGRPRAPVDGAGDQTGAAAAAHLGHRGRSVRGVVDHHHRDARAQRRQAPVERPARSRTGTTTVTGGVGPPGRRDARPGDGPCRRRPGAGRGRARPRTPGPLRAGLPSSPTPSGLSVMSRPGCPPTRTVPSRKERTERSRTSPNPSGSPVTEGAPVTGSGSVRGSGPVTGRGRRPPG